jgi:general secretion pathway protein E
MNEPKQLPFTFARRHGVVLEADAGAVPALYHRPDLSLQTLVEIFRYLGTDFRPVGVSNEQFDVLLHQNYEQSSNQAMQLMGDIDDGLDLAHIAGALPETEDLLESQDDAPIIRLINALLAEAVKDEVSDIHIEPFEGDLVVRFRVDGILREVIRPNRAIAPLLASRIKVMAKLDIAEKRLPQDGRISLRVAGRAVDVRVSTLPSGHGERVVLRLLDKKAGRLDLAQLGMDDATCSQMDELIHRPHGIVLVTGPTGSGKTTTLYAALTRLNDHKRNILTVEDPIEYYLDGIGQTQVNTKVDMSFARGLRAILRQDPDIVMVGEIRDLETVEIAVQASLTGHLVLSTLHTNTAIGAITRLRDMGVEPFLLSSSVIGVLSQRLVRVLCKACRRPFDPNQKDREMLGLDGSRPVELYAPVGCSHCNQTGYRGRVGIYELVGVDEHLRGMIHDEAGEHDMEAYAHSLTRSIRQDGVRKILAGETSMEEVFRVTSER